MKLRLGTKGLAAFSLAALAGLTAPAWAASDPASGDPIVGEVEVEPIELLDAETLEILVAPVALYPDDLLAVVLPASTYPLQIVLAARFLEAGPENADGDATQPSEEWDDAVVALLNYPEVVALMDGNLEWTRRLGEAVLVQEEDVLAAISAFREQAKKAGNLESDGKQDVVVNDAGAIEIKPAVPDEIYVPYYEPADVVVRQPVRVYHYYPRPYPVYYYPYHPGYDFAYGPFWGVTSAFSIGWRTRNLHLHHYGFIDHPYYSYRYHDPFYYRRPHLVLNIYDRDRRHRHRHRSDRHHRGNDWRSERSKRDHRRWASREGRRGDGRREDRRREFVQNEGRRSDQHGGDRRQRTVQTERPRGEGRGDDRQRGDRQRRTQRNQGQSIAQTLENGATPVIHRPTRITPLGEVPPQPTPNRTGASGAAAASAVSADPSPAQRTERQRTPGWRAERRGENARLPRSRSQAAEPVATRPAQQPNRALPTRQAQRQARPTRPAAAQPHRPVNAPQQARQVQRAERLARERMARQAPARPQPSRSTELSRDVRVNRAPPPRVQRPQATNRQIHEPTSRRAIRQPRPQPNLNRGAPPRVQRPSPATRQAVPQARPEPRINRQAPARVDGAPTPVRPAPQRPARPRSGPSREDYRSRQPR